MKLRGDVSIMCRFGVIRLGVGALMMLAGCWVPTGNPAQAFTIPEFSYGGVFENSFRTMRVPDDVRQYEMRSRTQIDVDSFIWQPWFLTVDTRITDDRTRELLYKGRGERRNNALRGSLKFVALPYSNFPTSLKFYHNDFRAGNKGARSKRVADGIVVRSNVRWSRTMAFSSGLDWDHSVDNGGGLSDRLNLNLGIDKQFETQFVRGALAYANVSSETGFADGLYNSDQIRFDGRHKWDPLDSLRLRSNLSMSWRDAAEGAVDTSAYSIGGRSRATWTPDGIPLTVSGRAHAGYSFDADTGVDGNIFGDVSEREIQASLDVNGRYIINRKTTASFEFGSDYSSKEEDVFAKNLATLEIVDTHTVRDRLSSAIRAGVNYQFDPRVFNKFQWSGRGAANIDFGVSDGFGFTETQGLSFDQNVRRQFEVPYLKKIRFTAGQGISASRTTEGEISVPFAANMAVSHNFLGPKMRGNTIVMFSDSQVLVGDEEATTLSLGLTHNNDMRWIPRFPMRSSFTTRAEYIADDDDPVSVDSSFTLSVSHSNLFGYPGLNMSSSLAFSAEQLWPVVFSTGSGNEASDDDIVSFNRSLNFRLTYGIGKVRANLNLRLSQTESGGLTDSLILRMNRVF